MQLHTVAWGYIQLHTVAYSYISYTRLHIVTYSYCMHACLHTYIPTYLPTYLPTYPPTYLPTYIPTYLHTHTPAYLPTYPPTHLPTYLITYVHTCMHACMYACVQFFTGMHVSRLVFGTQLQRSLHPVDLGASKYLNERAQNISRFRTVYGSLQGTHWGRGQGRKQMQNPSENWRKANRFRFKFSAFPWDKRHWRGM